MTSFDADNKLVWGRWGLLSLPSSHSDEETEVQRGLGLDSTPPNCKAHSAHCSLPFQQHHLEDWVSKIPFKLIHECKAVGKCVDLVQKASRENRTEQGD